MLDSGSLGIVVQIHISSHDGVPIYLQIVNQVKYLVASGRLEAGEEMPPIRALAEQLLVNPNTLARRERMRIVAERVDALLAEARQMNISTETLMELIAERDKTMRPAAADGT